MASNFTKRKIKEQKQKQDEQASADNSAPEVVLNRMAVDIVEVAPDQYVFVEIAYNLETGDAQVIRSQPTSRTVGLGYEVKKLALRNLNKFE